MPGSYAAREELAGRGVEFADAPHRIHTQGEGTEEGMTFCSEGEGDALPLMPRVTAS